MLSYRLMIVTDYLQTIPCWNQQLTLNGRCPKNVTHGYQQPHEILAQTHFSQATGTATHFLQNGKHFGLKTVFQKPRARFVIS